MQSKINTEWFDAKYSKINKGKCYAKKLTHGSLVQVFPNIKG